MEDCEFQFIVCIFIITINLSGLVHYGLNPVLIGALILTSIYLGMMAQKIDW